mgnify:CR=1 FL=1
MGCALIAHRNVQLLDGHGAVAKDDDFVAQVFLARNHDFLLGRTSFEAYFNAPPTSTSGSDRYYSADIGNVHVTVVDVHTLEMEPHEEWVESDLAASNAPFKVVAIHPPPISTASMATRTCIWACRSRSGATAWRRSSS